MITPAQPKFMFTSTRHSTTFECLGCQFLTVRLRKSQGHLNAELDNSNSLRWMDTHSISCKGFDDKIELYRNFLDVGCFLQQKYKLVGAANSKTKQCGSDVNV